MVVRPSILWRAPLAGAVAVAGISVPVPNSAQASEASGAATLRVATIGGVFRLSIDWPEALADNPPSIGAEVEDGVLIVRSSQAFNADVSELAARAPDTIRAARIDRDGRTLRVALKSPLKARVDSSFNRQVVDLVPAGYKGKFPGVDSPRAKKIRDTAAAVKQRAAAAEAARLAAPPPVVAVSVGQAPKLTRIAFEWSKPVGYSVKVEKNLVRIRFNVRAKADIAEMRIDPPQFLKSASQNLESRSTEVILELADGVAAKHFRDGAYVVVDLAEAGAPTAEEALAALSAEQKAKAEAAAKAAQPQPTEDHEATDTSADQALSEAPTEEPIPENVIDSNPLLVHGNPVKTDGIVKVEVESNRRGAEFNVAFEKPAAAAVFRRGQYIYAMFAAEANFDVRVNANGALADFPVTQLRGVGVSGLRIKAPERLYLSARPDGARWIIRLAPHEMAAPSAVRVVATDGLQGVELKAPIPGAAALSAVIDPDTGARIDLALAYGPATGIIREQRFVEALALPTAHGAAFETYASDLQYAVTQGNVRLRRSTGLLLSDASLAGTKTIKRGGSSGFIDFVTWRGKADESALAQIAKAEAAAAMAAPGAATAKARINLAKLLLGYELAPEALGALRLALEEDPKLEKTAQFLAMRGAANVMLGRFADADADFQAPASLSDPSIALWRGLVLLQKEDFAGARDAFLSGKDAVGLYTPNWRAKFHAAAARACIGVDDGAAAQVYAKAAIAAGASGEWLDEAKMAQASVKEKTGDPDGAFAILSDLTSSPREPTAVRAAFEATRLGVERGKMTPSQAIDALEALRFRWRGDGIEIETIRRLGSLYASVGRTREGLGVMRQATIRYPDQPAARRMAVDMSNIFDTLFVKGEADRLDPIAAVGLFYEFKDLTPGGADGDFMIRRLADRLVSFDLLAQADQLLTHQVNNRLHGLAKAQVATELASIQLADRRPQDALTTISASRVARLPEDLNRQRRLIQAAALADVGRFEHAVELLDLDSSKEAARLRADVLWRMKDWPNAARALQKLLPPPSNSALTAEQEDLVLRTAIAYQFAEDDDGLAKLNKSYGDAMNLGARSSAFDMVVTGLDTSGVRLAELAKRVAGDGLYDRFLERFKTRFAQESGAAAPAAGEPGAKAAAANGAPATG